MRTLFSLQYSESSPTDVPLSWQNWYSSSFVVVISRAVDSLRTMGIDVTQDMNALKAAKLHMGEEVAMRYARKQIQKVVYAKIVSGGVYQSLSTRLRHKLDRWQFTEEVHGIGCRRIERHLPNMGKVVAPRVLSSGLRTLYNGWCTARRFQSTGTCKLGCKWDGTDSLEHYAICPKVTRLRRALGLPESFHSLLGFMNGIGGVEDSHRALNWLVVFAVYSSVNTLRHSGPLSADQVHHMMMEFCKIGASSHKYSLRVLSAALGTGSWDLPVPGRGKTRARGARVPRPVRKERLSAASSSSAPAQDYSGLVNGALASGVRLPASFGGAC